MKLRRLILAIAIMALASRGGAQAKLRFAQITDVHLFDAGNNCYEPDVSIEHDAAINGLKWAVDKINEENRAAPIDFVVITGDLGIANLDGGKTPAHDQPSRNACIPETRPSHPWGPVFSEKIEVAAVNLAGFLRELNVPSIYLLPGNNDVPDNKKLGIEDPIDRISYSQFVQALSHELRGRVRDLSGILNPDSEAPWDHVQGYWLVGLDTASFKPSDIEKNSSLPVAQKPGKKTAPPPSTGSDQPPPCQDPAADSVTSTARTAQLSRVATLAASASGPFLLFTHIPDFQDPVRRDNGATDPVKKCSLPSSWMLVPESRKSWTEVVSNPKLVGVFAGHFHSLDGSLYGGPFRAASVEQPVTVRNIYVAPPLSLKNQWTSPDDRGAPPNPRRGILIVDVQGNSVRNVAIDWYGGINPAEYRQKRHASSPAVWPLKPEWIKTLVAFGIVAILILAWDLVVKR